MLPLVGCRPPAIPTEPTSAEYAVWGSVLAFETEAVAAHTVMVGAETLPLNEARLQFSRCLPRHMRAVFDAAPKTNLSKNVTEDWLRTSDGRPVLLRSHDAPIPDGAADLFEISRVAFSRFRREAFVWVDHLPCTRTETEVRCGDREGALLRAVWEGDRWRIEATDCQTLAFPDR